MNEVIVRRPLRTTEVYDSYWYLACERQRMFMRHLREELPYTSDPILAEYRFTNAYRASDRVSQFLIQDVIYEGGTDARELFFRTILFRLFNKIETWNLFISAFGELTWKGYRFEDYDRVLTHSLEAKQRIYSAAYIMPSRSQTLRSHRKHRNHLRLLEMMMNEDVPQRLADCKRASDAFLLLRSYPMIGDFLGYQFLTDLNYGPLLTFSENEFVIPGPGARSGIRKCFSDMAGLTDSDVIRLVKDSQEQAFEQRGLDFISLWGRPLHLIDCQNLFCEVDKYARVAHPHSTPEGGRRQIKQRFRPSHDRMMIWYPPKWSINERIPLELRALKR